MTDAQRIRAMRSLIGVLTSALKIVRQTHYEKMPGFTPEKTKGVVESAIAAAKLGEML